MASYERTYPVYNRTDKNRSGRIPDNLSVEELERIARGENIKTRQAAPRAAARKQPPARTEPQKTPKANMKKAAAQVAMRKRRQPNVIARLAFAGLGIAGLMATPKLFHQTDAGKSVVTTPAYVAVPSAK